MIKNYLVEYAFSLSRGEFIIYIGLAFILGWTVRALRSKSWRYRFWRYQVLHNMPRHDNTYLEYVPELGRRTLSRETRVPYYKNHAPVITPTGSQMPSTTITKIEKPKWDDLTIIEGIGPKIASVLANAGITTYKKLTETSVREVSSFLESAGISAGLHNPGTWASQAYLAMNQQWNELESLKQELVRGLHQDII